MSFRTIIEPFVIKSLEPLQMTTEAERIHALEEAEYNLFKIPSRLVMIDLLTNSGTGAMSNEQWAAIMRGDKSYAGSPSFERLAAKVKDLYGFQHVIPTHQGRAAERILFSTIVKAGQVVPNNNHFNTTRGNIEFLGAEAVDLVIPEGLDHQNRHPFKCNMDVNKLEELIETTCPEKIPFCLQTITNNSGGGQPLSMENIRSVRKVLERFGIPLLYGRVSFCRKCLFHKDSRNGIRRQIRQNHCS